MYPKPFTVRFTLGSAFLEVSADDELISLEIIPETKQLSDPGEMITLDATQAGLLAETLTVFKKRLEKGAE